MRSVAVHPVNASILYAGTNRGVYQSADGVSSRSFVGLSQDLIEDVVIDLIDPNVLFAGTAACTPTTCPRRI